MPRRDPLETGEYYHVFNRAIDDRILFVDNKDYQRFLDGLRLLNTTRRIKIREALTSTDPSGGAFPLGSVIQSGERLVDIVSYCLMTNHYHLLIKQRMDSGIQKFLQKLQAGYASYYNLCNARRGHLFQNQFQAVKIESDEQLISCVRYIHLNPLDKVYPAWRSGHVTDWQDAFEYLSQFKYSSARHYLGHEANELVDDIVANELIDYDHEQFLKEWSTREF